MEDLILRPDSIEQDIAAGWVRDDLDSGIITQAQAEEKYRTYLTQLLGQRN